MRPVNRIGGAYVRIRAKGASMNTIDELKGLPRDELEARFMRTLIRYHSEKWMPTGFFRAVPAVGENITAQLAELNKQLVASSGAQTRLAKALNLFTFLLVIVGAAQIYLRL